MPGLKFNPMMLLHGEQELRLFGPLASSGRITSHGRASGVYDKGKGALVTFDVESKDEHGTVVAFSRSSVFIRGIGGFGGEKYVGTIHSLQLCVSLYVGVLRDQLPLRAAGDAAAGRAACLCVAL